MLKLLCVDKVKRVDVITYKLMFVFSEYDEHKSHKNILVLGIRKCF